MCGVRGPAGGRDVFPVSFLDCIASSFAFILLAFIHASFGDCYQGSRIRQGLLSFQDMWYMKENETKY